MCQWVSCQHQSVSTGLNCCCCQILFQQALVKHSQDAGAVNSLTDNIETLDPTGVKICFKFEQSTEHYLGATASCFVCRTGSTYHIVFLLSARARTVQCALRACPDMLTACTRTAKRETLPYCQHARMQYGHSGVWTQAGQSRPISQKLQTPQDNLLICRDLKES